MENRITLCAFADEADKMIVNQIKALRENDMSLLEIRGVDGKNISISSTLECTAIDCSVNI